MITAQAEWMGFMRRRARWDEWGPFRFPPKKNNEFPRQWLWEIFSTIAARARWGLANHDDDKKVSGRKNSHRLFSMDQEEGERKLTAISIYFDGKKLQSVKVYSFSVATVRWLAARGRREKLFYSPSQNLFRAQIQLTFLTFERNQVIRSAKAMHMHEARSIHFDIQWKSLRMDFICCQLDTDDYILSHPLFIVFGTGH